VTARTAADLAPFLGMVGGLMVVLSPEPDRLPDGARGTLISLCSDDATKRGGRAGTRDDVATVDFGELGVWGFAFDFLAPAATGQG